MICRLSSTVCSGYNSNKIYAYWIMNKTMDSGFTDDCKQMADAMDDDFKKKAIMYVLGTFGHEGLSLEAFTAKYKELGDIEYNDRGMLKYMIDCNKVMVRTMNTPLYVVYYVDEYYHHSDEDVKDAFEYDLYYFSL